MERGFRFSLVLLFLLGILYPSFSQGSKYQFLISGMKEYKEGNYEKALEDFSKAEKLFPDDADIPFYIGLTYLQLDKKEKAIEYFKKTLKINSNYLDAHFQLGMIFIQEKNYKDAISHLERVFRQQPEKENLGYFLGYAYFNLGNYKKALYYFEKNKTSDKSIEQLNLYYSGLSKTYLGKTKEAQEFYKRVIEIDPSSPLAQPSKQLLAIRPVISKEKRLNFELTVRLQYDDNLILVPTTNVYNLRDRKRKTIIELLYFKGEYTILKTPQSQFLASYGLYQTICNSLRDNDVQNHIFSLDYLFKNFRLTYSYDHLLSDYKSFLYRHTLRPILIIQETSKNLTLFQYTFQNKTFKDTPLFDEDRRNAKNHEIGFVHFLRFNQGKHFFKVGYFYDREFAKGDNWDYQGNKGLVGFQYTLPKEIRFNLDYEYKNYHYEDINIFFDKHRKDIERSLTIGLSKDIGKDKDKTIFLEYSRTINSSNIALYDYKKNLVSVGMSWRW
ncbi:MAG: tetratricopeptide repeat protein [Candidatus Omnitrophica bacterium]|nr:tetratricopeptide repeat protein [Candidatus Omnitrophota bacterium]